MKSEELKIIIETEYENNRGVKIIDQLIEEYHPYKKMEIDLSKINIEKIQNSTYNSYCKKSKSKQTFELILYPFQIMEYYSNLPAEPPVLFLDQNYKDFAGHLNYTQHFRGICKCCNEYFEDYLLNFFSDRRYPKNNNGKKVKFYIRKIGQNPPFKLKMDQKLVAFLNDEDLKFYQKAKMNFSSGYSIGAYSYFRRIIENQIIAICESVSKLNTDESKKVEKALKEYYINHQMSKLIEESYKHFPNSIKDLGDNPLRLLHGELSGGIHTFSEDECYDKANAIDQILIFVISKLYEENTVKKSVIEAIKKLK